MPKGQPQILTDGRLRFAAAEAVDVRAQTPQGTFRLFKIQFGRDGSIYVPFPCAKGMRGFLSEADPSTEPDPKTIQLARNGVTVDYDAKFAHHTSGAVHFSLSGKSDPLPRRQSFRLDGPIGKLFTFNAFDLGGFERLTRSGRRGEIGLNLTFPTHPSSIAVTAEWVRKKDINANVHSERAFIGPDVTVEERASGAMRRCIILGQPPGLPLQDHVVMLSAQEVPLPDGADGPTAVFWGGHDEHEGKPPATAKMLIFMYTARRAVSEG